MQIATVKSNKICFPSAEQHAMFRLRYFMFKERLNWDVETDNGLEFDEFDRMDPLYLIAQDDSTVVGCWRILPTTGPNMLRDIFPELLAGNKAPCGHDIWELSRFAVCRQSTRSFGLSTLPVKMMLHAVEFALSQGVRQFVTVTTVAMERLLKHVGLAPTRLGPSLQIGVERTVALSFDLSDLTILSLKMALNERNHLMQSGEINQSRISTH
jgi:acyl homoserine lactone synthase